MDSDNRHRCSWPGDDPLMISYHDEEWGLPVHDDRKWFEFIDQGRPAEAYLMKSATDVIILE